MTQYKPLLVQDLGLGLDKPYLCSYLVRKYYCHSLSTMYDPIQPDRPKVNISLLEKVKYSIHFIVSMSVA